MYIPLENLMPSHANCMQHVLRCWEKGNLTAQNTRRPFGGRGSAPDPAERAYRAPANPLVGGEGLAVPSPRTPFPLSALRASPLLSSTPKLVPTPLLATLYWEVQKVIFPKIFNSDFYSATKFSDISIIVIFFRQ